MKCILINLTFEDDYTVKWDGEWQITLEVFRDLGIAFLGVIIINLHILLLVGSKTLKHLL